MSNWTWRFEYRCPTAPWSQNEERRWVWQRTRRQSQPWYDLGHTIAKSSALRGGIDRARVKIILIFDQHRRRDPMNYVSTVGKALIDGMVGGGAWPDDTPEWVVGPEVDIRVNGLLSWPQVEVEVTLEPTGGQDE